jgi:hypothetical protein
MLKIHHLVLFGALLSASASFSCNQPGYRPSEEANRREVIDNGSNIEDIVPIGDETDARPASANESEAERDARIAEQKRVEQEIKAKTAPKSDPVNEEEAGKVFQELVKGREAEGRAAYAKGAELYSHGDMDNALKLWEESVKFWSANPDLKKRAGEFMNEADSLFSSENYSAAQGKYKFAMTLDHARGPEAREKIMECMLKTSDLETPPPAKEDDAPKEKPTLEGQIKQYQAETLERDYQDSFGNALELYKQNRFLDSLNAFSKTLELVVGFADAEVKKTRHAECMKYIEEIKNKIVSDEALAPRGDDSKEPAPKEAPDEKK